MQKYHKIQSLFHRDPVNNNKTFNFGEWSRPEFHLLRNNEWTWTEKIDGTNIRIFWGGALHNDDVIFGGRTDNAQIPGRLVQYLAKTFTPEMLKSVFGPEGNLVLCGEGYGSGIMKGGGDYMTDGEQRFILFDIMSVNDENGLDVFFAREDVEEYGREMGLPFVPVVGKGTLLEAAKYTQTGFTSFVGTQWAEGLVLRPSTELKDRMGNRIITKLKARDFRLGQDVVEIPEECFA